MTSLIKDIYQIIEEDLVAENYHPVIFETKADNLYYADRDQIVDEDDLEDELADQDLLDFFIVYNTGASTIMSQGMSYFQHNFDIYLLKTDSKNEDYRISNIIDILSNSLLKISITPTFSEVRERDDRYYSINASFNYWGDYDKKDC